jgi:transcription elongation factor GreB
LLKKEVGDEFMVVTPEGEKWWWVNVIEYVKPE